MQPVKEITINGITFKLKFGLKVSRLLGEKWGLDSFDEVLKKFSEIEQLTIYGISFSKLEIVFDVVLMCISANEENENTITRDDLETLFDENINELLGIIQTIITGYTESLPKQTVPEKKLKALKSATHSPGTK